MRLGRGDTKRSTFRGATGSGGRLPGLLALAVPVLVISGLASAGAISAQHRGDSGGVVIAAGQGVDGLALPLSTSLPPTGGPASQPVPEAASSTVAPPTTVRPTTTVARPTSTTTARPAPPITTAPPVTTSPAPPASATGGQAMVTLRSTYTEAVQLKVNGQTYELAAGQQVGPVAVTPAPSGNDIIELRVSANPGCGEGDADGYFVAGHRYLLTVSTGRNSCPPAVSAPSFAVTPA